MHLHISAGILLSMRLAIEHSHLSASMNVWYSYCQNWRDLFDQSKIIKGWDPDYYQQTFLFCWCPFSLSLEVVKLVRPYRKHGTWAVTEASYLNSMHALRHQFSLPVIRYSTKDTSFGLSFKDFQMGQDPLSDPNKTAGYLYLQEVSSRMKEFLLIRNYRACWQHSLSTASIFSVLLCIWRRVYLERKRHLHLEINYLYSTMFPNS